MNIQALNDIKATLRWLETSKNAQPRQGLERLSHALTYLGDPHKVLSIIHITGTNGKGTVTAFLTQLLMSQQLTVGTFTSPHIMRFNERISVNGEAISDTELIALTQEMIALNDYLQAMGFGQLVGFELYTAMACVYFARKQCDVCLIEVGIGGREDCTNVLDGQVAVITTIGLDHTDKLGGTLTDIAYQKAGIIKPNATVVTGAIVEEAMMVIRQEVEQQSATLFAYTSDFAVTNVQLSPEGAQFSYGAYPFSIRLLGEHQVDNASVALRAFEAWMTYLQREIDWVCATRALHEAHWPARMEKAKYSPLIYLDGAHNPVGLEALREMLELLFSDYEIVLLYSGLSTKNQKQHLDILDTFGVKQIVLTEFKHLHAMSLADFNQLVRNSLHHQTDWKLVNDWSAFVTHYIDSHQSNPCALLIVTGSLYFVSEVRQFLLES